MATIALHTLPDLSPTTLIAYIISTRGFRQSVALAALWHKGAVVLMGDIEREKAHLPERLSFVWVHFNGDSEPLPCPIRDREKPYSAAIEIAKERGLGFVPSKPPIGDA